jgi:TonB family protein
MRVSILRCLTASILLCTLMPTTHAQAPAPASTPPATPAPKAAPTKQLASNTEATEDESKRFMANPLDPAAPVTSLAIWDATISIITNSAAYARQQAAPRKEVGPRLTAAWDKYVLAPDAKAQLETLRQRATKEAEAKNEKAVERTVAEASKLINDQKFRFNAVAAFSNASDALELQRQLLLPWVERGTDADRTKADNLLTTGETALAGTLEEVIKAKHYDAAALKKLSSAIAPTLRELNAQRVALAQGPIFTSNPVPLALISREAACPPPVAGVEGKEKPALGPNFPSAEEFYPAEAKAASIEGAVNVRVSISETGCVTQAAIAATSGASNLDVAALQLAMAGSYRPGMKDGKPLAGSLTYRIKFELRE